MNARPPSARATPKLSEPLLAPAPQSHRADEASVLSGRSAEESVPMHVFLGIVLTAASITILFLVYLSPAAGLFLTLGLVLLSVHTWSVSHIVAWHLAQLSVLFGLPTLLSPPDSGNGIAVVGGWALAVTAGAHLATPLARRNPPRASYWPRLSWRHVLVGFVLAGVQFSVAYSGRSGIAAQLESGVSSASGVEGLLSSVSGAWAVAVLVSSAIAGGRILTGGVILFITQVFALAQSGFRGHSVSLIIATGVSLSVLLPPGHRWKQRQGILKLALSGTALSLGGFWFAAIVKNRIALTFGLSSAGTQLPNTNWREYLLTRIDLMDPLGVALASSGSASVRDAVSWSHNAVAFLPRFLYPDKPTISYGQDIAREVFGLRGNTSSTITFLGDIYLNAGVVGVCAIALLLGFGLRKLELHARFAVSSTALLCVVAASFAITSPEASPMLLVVEATRTVLLTLPLWSALSVWSWGKEHATAARSAPPPGRK